ncbi:MAG: retropepsin-like domain-containing protein [Phycisphaerae bacterium]|nr:retropepsin-like domain-containing protein [Phycisphaerae bacterium]
MQNRNNSTRIFGICVLLFLSTAFLSGCGLRYVEVKNLEKLNSPRLVDPNTSPFEITASQTEPNRLNLRFDTKITQEKPCRVNYRWLEFNIGKNVVINGQLPNGKTYPVWIDSGCSGADLLFNPLIVRENKLETLFSYQKLDSETSSSLEQREYGGFCYLPSLKIDKLKIQNPYSVFVPWRMEWHALGIPVWRDKRVLMGISLMSQFRYLYFDNVNKQLEFSHSHSFEPMDPNEWASYPMNPRKEDQWAMVDIPIAGIQCNFGFDTGGAGIVLMPATWEKIRAGIDTTKLKESHFLSHQYGYLPCHKTVVKELSIGNITIKNAKIVILPNDTPYLSKGITPGYISIWEFKDTSVVLDFEHHLMWVKNRER